MIVINVMMATNIIHQQEGVNNVKPNVNQATSKRAVNVKNVNKNLSIK